MLEVVFSDSEKGAMRLAKRYDETAMHNGPISYIGKKPSKAELKELKRRYAGKPVGGDPSEVVSIGFLLDIGAIDGELDGAARIEVLRRLWGRFNFDGNASVGFFQSCRADADKLLSAAQSGTPLRLWVSSAPYSVCGFYYVCYLLREIDCQINIIFLPDYMETENGAVSYSTWGEVMPGQFYRFLPLQRTVSAGEKRMRAEKWRALMLENAPLRAVVNGMLLSVPETFYDSIILNNLPDGEFVMAKLIGDLLGTYRIGVSDSWYALRIEQMIADGVLTVVCEGDASHPYGKQLKKA